MRNRPVLVIAVAMALLAVALFGYSKGMALVGSGAPPAYAAPEEQADRIIVSKSDRKMYLLRGADVLKTYDVSMGMAWGAGHKQREGDQRTPEGDYLIDWRNPKSVAHLSLHISYPNAADKTAAAANGYSPGGDIMIHGLPNGWGALGRWHTWLNWTDGCVAVTNAEMREIWSLTPTGTPISLYPQWSPPV